MTKRLLGSNLLDKEIFKKRKEINYYVNCKNKDYEWEKCKFNNITIFIKTNLNAF